MGGGPTAVKKQHLLVRVGAGAAEVARGAQQPQGADIALAAPHEGGGRGDSQGQQLHLFTSLIACLATRDNTIRSEKQ